MAIIKTYPTKSTYYAGDKFLISDMQPDSDGNVSGNTKNITFSTLKSLIGGGSGSGAVSSVVASGTFGTVTPTTGDVKIGYSITGLTEAVSSTLRTDLLLVVDDPSGTPINKKISFTNMMDTSALQASDSQSGFLSSADWSTFNAAGRGGSPDTSVVNGVQFNKKGSFGAVEWLTILNTDISNVGLLLGSPLGELGGLGANSGKLNILSGKIGRASINLYDATTNTKFVGILGPSTPPEKNYNIALPQGEPEDGQVLSVKSFREEENFFEMSWANNAGGGGSVESVGARDPIFSSGGTSPEITMAESTDTSNGWLSSTNFESFSKKQQAITLTTDETSGKATFVNNILNIPAYESGGGGGLKSVGLTMPSAFKVGNSPLTADGTITVGVDGGEDGQFLDYLGEWSTPKAGGGTVTKVEGSAPIVSSGGTTPSLSMAAASESDDGYLSSTNFTAFKGKQAALVSTTNIKSINGNSILGSGNLVIGSSAAPGGSNNQIQYNNNSTLDGDSKFTLVPTPSVTTVTIGNSEGLSVSYGKLKLQGDNSTEGGKIEFQTGAGRVGSEIVTLQAPSTGVSQQISLPDNLPTANTQILGIKSISGTGVQTQWETPSGGGSSAYTSYEALFSTTDGIVSLVELSNNTGLAFSWVDTRLGNINITIQGIGDGEQPWVMVNGYGNGAEEDKIQCFFGGISSKNIVVIDILNFGSEITKGNIASGNIEIRIY